MCVSRLGSSKGDKSGVGGLGLGGLAEKDIAGEDVNDIDALGRSIDEDGDRGGDRAVEYLGFIVGDDDVDTVCARETRPFSEFTCKCSFLGGGGGGFAFCGGNGGASNGAVLNFSRRVGESRAGGSVFGTGSPANLCLRRCMTIANSSWVSRLSRFKSASILGRRVIRGRHVAASKPRTHHMRPSSCGGRSYPIRNLAATFVSMYPLCSTSSRTNC